MDVSADFALQLPHLLYGLIVVSLVVMYGAARYAIGARREVDINRQMRRLQASNQPWVTVLIYANEDQSIILPFLKVLARSRYGAFDVVVVDDGSGSQVTLDVKASRNYFEKRHIRFDVLRRRTKSTRSSALLAGYRKSRHGELVLELDASHRIDVETIKRAVASSYVGLRQKRGKESWKYVIPLRFTTDSLVAIIDSFRLALLPDTTHISRRTSFIQSTQDKEIYSPPASETLMAPRAIPAVAAGIILCVAVVAGITYDNLLILWYGWIVYTMGVLVGTWRNSESTTYDKFVLILSAPGALFLVPVAGLIRWIERRVRLARP